MQQIISTCLYIMIALVTTSCMGTEYFDSHYRPVQRLEIPAKGDTILLELVNEEYIYYTRFQPGRESKHYRYRTIEDGFVGPESEDMFWPEEYFYFDANETGLTKTYEIEVKIAYKFHDGFFGCHENDKFQDWETAWIITQPSM